MWVPFCSHSQVAHSQQTRFMHVPFRVPITTTCQYPVPCRGTPCGCPLWPILATGFRCDCPGLSVAEARFFSRKRLIVGRGAPCGCPLWHIVATIFRCDFPNRPRTEKMSFAPLRGSRAVLRALPFPGSSLKTKNRLLKTAVPPSAFRRVT